MNRFRNWASRTLSMPWRLNVLCEREDGEMRMQNLHVNLRAERMRGKEREKGSGKQDGVMKLDALKQERLFGVRKGTSKGEKVEVGREMRR